MSRILQMLLLIFSSLLLMGSRNIGSAKKLEGKVYTLIIFISDTTDQWTTQQKNQMIQQVIDAEDWRSKQAQVYGKTLAFEHGSYGLETDIELSNLPEGLASGKEDVSILIRTMQKIGFKNNEDLNAHIQADHIQVLLFLKKNGNSYSMPFEEGLDSIYELEAVVLYEKFEEHLPLCTACIAHETLHIFGAWDLYKTFQTTAKQEEIARKRYPNSIMLRTTYNIFDLEIDPRTAWRIGWRETKPTNGEFFRPYSPPPEKR
ncbi:MAG: hypothetical protein VX278_11755 [Myxococcota bacterium]|nr:hypothetical protein [Myxococcota bacterium]